MFCGTPVSTTIPNFSHGLLNTHLVQKCFLFSTFFFFFMRNNTTMFVLSNKYVYTCVQTGNLKGKSDKILGISESLKMRNKT